MDENENLGSFFKENKELVNEYLETRLKILKLSSIRVVSKSVGSLVWMAVLALLAFMILLFLLLVAGFWFSELTDSFVIGFGIATLILLFIFGVLALFRKSLFINPVIRALIMHATEELADDTDDTENLV